MYLKKCIFPCLLQLFQWSPLTSPGTNYKFDHIYSFGYGTSNLLLSNSHFPLIHKPTRIVKSSASLIANMHTNYTYDLNQGSTYRKIWCYRVKMFFFIEIEHEHIILSRPSTCGKSHIEYHKHVYFERIWKEKLNTEFAVRGQDAGGNKLRT